MTTPDLVDPRLSALADGRLIVTGRGFDSYVAATETDDGWSLRSLDNLMPTGAGTTITVLQTAFTDHGTFVVATAGVRPGCEGDRRDHRARSDRR